MNPAYNVTCGLLLTLLHAASQGKDETVRGGDQARSQVGV